MWLSITKHPKHGKKYSMKIFIQKDLPGSKLVTETMYFYKSNKKYLISINGSTKTQGSQEKRLLVTMATNNAFASAELSLQF